MIRTHDAGALRADHVGQTVTLAGWVARRRDHGGVAFLDLRERSGVVQVVVRDEAVAHSLRSEFCLKVVGEVVARKAGNENPHLATGEIEVVASEVEVLSTSDPLPFPIVGRVSSPLLELCPRVGGHAERGFGWRVRCRQRGRFEQAEGSDIEPRRGVDQRQLIYPRRA